MSIVNPRPRQRPCFPPTDKPITELADTTMPWTDAHVCSPAPPLPSLEDPLRILVGAARPAVPVSPIIEI
jgi:hypothetical protein